MAAGLDLLRKQEAARAEFRASVLAAEEEADRDGWVSGDHVMARIEAMLTRNDPTRG